MNDKQKMEVIQYLMMDDTTLAQLKDVNVILQSRAKLLMEREPRGPASSGWGKFFNSG